MGKFHLNSGYVFSLYEAQHPGWEHTLLIGCGILEFHLDTQNLSVIEKPADVCHSNSIDFQRPRTEDGVLGLAIVLRL